MFASSSQGTYVGVIAFGVVEVKETKRELNQVSSEAGGKEQSMGPRKVST